MDVDGKRQRRLPVKVLQNTCKLHFQNVPYFCLGRNDLFKSREERIACESASAILSTRDLEGATDRWMEMEELM